MSSSTTDLVAVDVVMPAMGSSVVEGTLLDWRVAVGDVVAADDPLCDISTDKVDSECPSPAAGVVLEILVQAGETVDVGTPIARIGDPAAVGDAAGDDAPVAGRTPAADDAGAAREGDTGGPVPQAARAQDVAEPADAATTAAEHPGGPGPGREGRREALRRSSPVALRIAGEHGLDVFALEGSGRGGRVTKQDVLHAVEHGAAVADEPMHIESPYRHDPDVPVVGAPATPSTPAPAPEPPAPARLASSSAPAPAAPDDLGGVAQPASRMRTQIGDAMRRALDTAAHCTTIVECDMSRIERRRRELGITALPLVAAHAVETLREFPALNATLQDGVLTTYERVHLGIAVSLGEEGLIVPVLHDAQDLSPAGIGARIKDVARRARGRKLTADDVRGGTFTITNPGAAGAVIATPVINVPQVAILDLEAIVKRPVVVTDADGADSIAIRPMVNLCMSWDHRAIDGMYAAQFLTALRRRLEA